MLVEGEVSGGGGGGGKRVPVEEVKEIRVGGRMKLEKRMEGKVEEEKDKGTSERGE